MIAGRIFSEKYISLIVYIYICIVYICIYVLYIYITYKQINKQLFLGSKLKANFCIEMSLIKVRFLRNNNSVTVRGTEDVENIIYCITCFKVL